ncbi:hypothetical protein D3C71_1475640 [compost metagenome]
MAARQARRQAGDPQPQGRDGRERSAACRRAGQGPDPQHRPPHPVPGLQGTAQRAGGQQGGRRLDGDHGRDHRRDPGHGQPADLQPELAQRRGAGHAPQPCGDRSGRAGFDDEAADHRHRAAGRGGDQRHRDRHQPGLHAGSPLHHPRCAAQQRRAERHRRDHPQFQHRRGKGRGEDAGPGVLRWRAPLRLRLGAAQWFPG